MPDITLTIVTYNNEAHVRSAIDGIVAGMTPLEESGDSSPDYSIIIVDNASTDGTKAAVEESMQKYPGLIEWIGCKFNNGFGKGHNRAIPFLKSLYHVVGNADIVVPQGALLEMARFMDTNPEVGLLTPKIMFPDGRLQYLCKRNPTFVDLFIRLVLKNAFRARQDRYEMRETNYDHVFDVEYASGCFMFFRTEVFLRVHGFDEKFFLYLEDADITRRVNEVSRTVFHPGVHVVHEWQREQHKKPSLMWVNLQSWLYYWWKWRARGH